MIKTSKHFIHFIHYTRDKLCGCMKDSHITLDHYWVQLLSLDLEKSVSWCWSTLTLHSFVRYNGGTEFLSLQVQLEFWLRVRHKHKHAVRPKKRKTKPVVFLTWYNLETRPSRAWTQQTTWGWNTAGEYMKDSLQFKDKLSRLFLLNWTSTEAVSLCAAVTWRFTGNKSGYRSTK